MKTYQSADAKKLFGTILTEVGHEPIRVKKYGVTVAYIISARLFDKYLKDKDGL